MTRPKSNAFTALLKYYKYLRKEYFKKQNYSGITSRQYLKIHELTRTQSWIAHEFKKVKILLLEDPNFSVEELDQMFVKYRIILHYSMENITLLTHLISSLSSNMKKEPRHKLIKNVQIRVNKNLRDFKKYHKQNILISIQRADSAEQKDRLEKIYGLSQYKNSA